MYPRKFALWCCFALLFALSSAAQEPTPDAKAKAEKAEREKKAWAALDDIITEAQALKLPENRAYVQATAAELLWQKDEARARTLFQAAASALAQMMSSIESDDPSYYHRIQVPNHLRQTMLQTVARRDAQLALEFLRSTRPPHPPEYNANQPDPEIYMEMQLASLVIAKDPKRALQLAEESLQKGATSEVMQTIVQLQAKDLEAARQLTSKVVQKLKSEDFLKSHSPVQVAGSLLGIAQNNAQANDPKQRPLLSEQETKELVEVMLAAALSKTHKSLEGDLARQALYSLQNFMPLVEKYAPTQTQALRKQMTTLNVNVNPHEKAFQDFNQLQQKGTVEQLLEFAKQSAPELRDQFYSQAAWKAINQGEFDRAREMISTHISVHHRRGMLENLDTNQMQRLANEGKLEEARRALARLPNERKALSLLQLIDMVAVKAEKKALLSLLEEARTLSGTRAENQSQFYAQMQIIRRFVQFDPEHSFAMFDPYITQLNVLVAASEVLDGIEERQAFFNGEARIQSANTTALNMLTQLAEPLALAAEVDFDRAHAIANRFDRNETRLLTRLLLVRKICQVTEEEGEVVSGNGTVRSISRPRH
ncbi:MAG TPA: hypothetical protein VFZ34_16740 [Blastocatellia bacterium]|nr:hypothetical protein [Blastocatellia bacterium]